MARLGSYIIGNGKRKVQLRYCWDFKLFKKKKDGMAGVYLKC